MTTTSATPGARLPPNTVAVLTIELDRVPEGFKSHESMLEWIRACLNTNTNHVRAQVRTPTNREAAQAVRANGGAAVVFSEDEIGDADARAVEAALTGLSSEVIDALCDDPQSRSESCR